MTRIASDEEPGLPSGTVTFLFSDIEGSTRLWESAPDLMDRALATHDRIVREHVASAGGKVLKHTGDGFAAVFEAPSEAVGAATGITRALAGHEWGPCPIRVRMGIHVGTAHPRDGDYFGTTINQAARVMDAGNGGQVLLSDAVAALTAGSLPAGVTLADCGPHRLKDLGQPVHLWHLLIGDVATDDRTLRTLDSMPNNLPAELSSFVGRHREIADLREALQHARLVTLTGVGGVGKTRLALQVAAELIGHYADGVWLIELASLSEPDFLAQTAVAALKLPTVVGGTDSLELLLTHLAHRRALIVLDNCEHLIDHAAKLVDSVLVAAPGVHVLATSREALAVSGETRWLVPSLGVRSGDDEAVELFVDRAMSMLPDFQLTADNRDAVKTICRRLDGIPLAIELAVARLTMLAPDQILEQLDDRFRLLTGGSRTALGRQRTLLGMMDWSYELLTDSERLLLRRLSVFSDGFDLDAVQAVCAADPLSPSEVFHRLGRLVDESMVQFEREPAPRYRLLETVREYARAKLVGEGEAEAISGRHADHFEQVSNAIEEMVESGQVEAALRLGELELANLRAAMGWAYSAGRVDQGLSIAVHLRAYFYLFVTHREALTWLRRGLDIVEPTASPLYVLALSYALTAADNLAEFELEAELRKTAEDLLGEIHDPVMEADLNNAIANATAATDPRTSLARHDAAIQLYRSADDPRWVNSQYNRLFEVSLTG